MHMWWEQWKERLKNIFTKEVEIEVEEEPVTFEKENDEKQSNIQAKVTYHYPSGRSFKFPVIPDTADQKKETTIDNQPSYKRRNQDTVSERRNRRTNRETNDRRETAADKKPETHHPLPNQKRKTTSYRQTNHNRSTSHEVNNEGRKVYKKNPDVPFQPTEVPSPIYGFQPRKSKIIDDVPAYQRKETTDSKDKEAASSLEDTMISSASLLREKEEVSRLTPDDTENDCSEEDETDVSESEDTSDNQKDASSEERLLQEETIFEQPEEIQQDNDRTTEAPGREEVPAQETPSEPEKQEPEEQEKENITEKRNPIHTTTGRQNQDNTKKNNKTTAFNVMMTPRDKKNLQEQQKRETTLQRLQQAHEKREDEQRKAEERINEKYAEKQAAEITSLETAATVDEPQSKEVPLHLLNDPVTKSTEEDEEWLQEQQDLLEETLKHFQVKAKVVKATQGPSVTRFEVHPEMGVKVSKIKNLADDLKLNMSAEDIRIEAPIPGKNTVGIEVPNRHPEMVGLQRIIESDDFKDSSSSLNVALGLTIEGMPKVIDINKMPHGLIAGATGSGKSVCINTILVSLIYNASHEDVRILLIDPKMVELAPYNGIPHLVSPVITDVKAATQSLKWAVAEMEDRYDRFVNEGVRDIGKYNQKMLREGRKDKKMPYIVIVIDELADLMMMSPQDVEDAISRIAQKARACGIHLLLATQRPSVDVITGLIKANIPTRIAFSVSSQVDSRTIIDSSGAEKLLGRGDMLLIENGAGKSVRLQGPFVSDEEIERVANYAKSMAEPQYLFEQEDLLEQIQVDEEEDNLLEDAIEFVLDQNSASTSSLQRHFKIGYNRAARLIDSLEQRGIISGQNGSRAREVLITKAQRDSM
ncbi:DNA translocase FtsK [Oceanobacillus timonensis]|uniref:DNA translocase FtsK n=1 Tax=Oceanobacillus timonensis TaxID=1926285 RepID=UPI001FE51B2C|nr:DNA translocase FtsK [Oceanobacillus timonensis]